MKDIIVFDGIFQIVVDDVSEGEGMEFRASIYKDGELVSDAWADDVATAIGFGFSEIVRTK